MKTPKLYAALDLHSARSVLGQMNRKGTWLGAQRFPTGERHLVEAIQPLGRNGVVLTMEAGPLTRWAARIIRPLVQQLVICDPRQNKVISRSGHKCDEQDTFELCRLLRLDGLKEVWQGEDTGRDIFRAWVYELLNWRDSQRELKTLLKARYRQWGLLTLKGRAIFDPKKRVEYLQQLPSSVATMLEGIYHQWDHAMAQWKLSLREIKRAGKAYPEIAQFEKIPGLGEVGAHVFSAIIECPHRFPDVSALWKYSRLGISDGKPLGYERLDPHGNSELKNLSYHAWRTACRSTTGDNEIKRFYQASLLRSGVIRHARLNTQRKLLAIMWTIWRKGEPYDPLKAFPSVAAPACPRERSVRERM